uniref:Uncharacterized protein n=1 Tax=Ciona savignyi TaxID=51511 RepID=H2YWS6_CIOSA
MNGPDETIEEASISTSDSLKVFLSTCLQQTSDKAVFLNAILHMLTLSTWSPVSLLHVLDAIHGLDTMTAWGKDAVADLFELTTKTVRTHNVILRKTIQRILLGCFLKFVDTSNISLDDALRIFHYSMKESAFSRNSKLWKMLAVWLVGNFPNLSESVAIPKVYVLNRVKQFLQKESFQLQENEVHYVSLGAVLLLDGSLLKEGHSPEELVTQLISEICAITDKAGTHAYLSEGKISSAFQLIDSLLNILNQTFS